MKKIVATGVASAALVVGALVAPASAQALTGDRCPDTGCDKSTNHPAPPTAQVHVAHTVMSWGGMRCVEAVYRNGDYRGGLTGGQICSPSGTWAWDEYPMSGSGQMYGVGLPLDGGVAWVQCHTYLDGQQVASDYATAAMGSGEANCLRTA